MVRGWVWTVTAVFGIAVAVTLVFLVHEHPSWGQPIESAGGAAAAIFAALAGVASAISATQSRKTSQDAARALLLHERPVVSPRMEPHHGDLSGPTQLTLGYRPDISIRQIRSVELSWMGSTGARHRWQRFDPLGSFSLEDVPTQQDNNGDWAVGHWIKFRIVDTQGMTWQTEQYATGGDHLGWTRFTPLVPVG